MDKPASVRLATVNDEKPLFDLLVDLHRHNEAGWGFPYSRELVSRRIEIGTRPQIPDKQGNPPLPRSDPNNREIGLIGVIGPPGGRLIGAVGVYFESFFWFTTAPAAVEIFLYVRPEERNQKQYHRDLMDFSVWAHGWIKQAMPEYRLPLPLFTGFVHMNPKGKLDLMERLWRRLSGAQKIGSLYGRR